jgi:hypothetical protein
VTGRAHPEARRQSQQEKKEIRYAVLSKVQNYYDSVSKGKKPLGECRALAPRLLFADKPQRYLRKM